MRTIAPFVLSLALLAGVAARALPDEARPGLADPREVHLADLRQLTDGGENAEAYWSPDGRELVFQSLRPPFACDQIFRLRADGSGAPVQVSSGKGRTTCSYFTADGERVLFSSTQAASPDCPPAPDRSQGYVWPIYDSYEIYSARPDGKDVQRLTDNQAYDAEATVCPKDGSVIFTSTRDGDLELYRMDAGGGNVRRLTKTPGYDGGAFFSPDCSRIVWRASRPAAGAELEDFQRLLGQGLVRPGKLEIWVANADGTDARQITYLGAASFAPSFFPSGERVIFSSNVGDPKGREFDLWAVDVDGTDLERITYTPGFDGFPLFSPDGKLLAFASNRNQEKQGETNVFVARWAASGRPAGEGDAANGSAPSAADRYLTDVAWLADDARQGRGIGTAGLEQAARYLADRFRELGLEPAGQPEDKSGGFFHSFDVPVAIEVGEDTMVAVDGQPLARELFQPASFSSTAEAAGEVVAAGYGITAPDLGVDDYGDLDVAGKIVVVRRFTPVTGPFAGEEAQRRHGDLRLKAWNAREHGAAGLIVVDLPEGNPQDEAALPAPTVDAQGDAGIPVVFLARSAGAPLFEGGRRAALRVELRRRTEPALNVVARLRAGAASRQPGAVLVGAHYDHLGMGGSSSLAPGVEAPHNGADDNASGTAALLEAARQLASRRAELARDVVFVAFSGEEAGTLGSTAFTREPPGGLAVDDLVAMLNMDMVGRLRENRLQVLGGESAEGWGEVVDPACAALGLVCSVGGEGYGPSDHTPFYTAGLPVLHFFSGVHQDYHKPSDDTATINAAGGARVAALVADVAQRLAARPERLVYKNAPAPVPQGDVRSGGASLGTVPDYAGPADGRPGVLLADVRPGSAADQAGIRRGDLLVELAGTPIRDIHDFTFVLRRAKPGEKAVAVVEREGRRVELDVVFGAPTRR